MGTLRRISPEWWKRIAVFAITALWAILARELTLKFGLSKWIVTGISTLIFFVGFWLADIAGRVRQPAPKRKP